MINLFLTLLIFASGFSLNAYSEILSDKPGYENFSKNGQTYTFVDFQTANYKILYNLLDKKVSYIAQIKFNVAKTGRPLFDVKNTPEEVKIGGVSVTANEVSYNNFNARYVDQILTPGVYELEMKGAITDLLDFSTAGEIRSSFWLNDLADRSFLERYLPSSFEYDRVKMTFDIELIGQAVDHLVIANGEVETVSSTQFRVNFPAYYTSSSLFFHIAPEKNVHSIKSTYESIDGRKIPVFIYHTIKAGDVVTNREKAILADYMSGVERHVFDLEARFGAFLHDQIIVYAADGGGAPGIGGMEYCGATMTDRRSLNHELIHNYFGRGLMPSNGNAGWIDEAITTWAARTNYRPMSPNLRDPRHLYGNSSYIRHTHRGAYSEGMAFIGGLASTMNNNGHKPLTDFLKYIVEEYKYKTYTSEDFWSWSVEFYNFSFLDLIVKSNMVSPWRPARKSNHDVHKRISDEVLQKLL